MGRNSSAIFAILSLLAMTEPSTAGDGLLKCGRCIGTTLAGSTGIGTAEAKARSIVAEADVVELCSREALDPGRLADCLEEARRNDLGIRLSASANCTEGVITNVDGRHYRRVGQWGDDEPTGLAVGEPRFARADGGIVPTDHAGGGRELATNWRLLCGDVAPVGTGRPVAFAGSTGRVLGEPFRHNGSRMTIDVHGGIIAYAVPKPGIRKQLRPQAVLFHGSMSDPRDVRGTAFTFKAGCEPAPYDVRGRFADGYQSTLTLIGKAPVRSTSGCAVVGYSAASPNARLVFEYESPPEL